MEWTQKLWMEEGQKFRFKCLASSDDMWEE